MNIRCVLRSGGPYDVEYVKRIFDAVKGQNIGVTCLTDIDVPQMPHVNFIPLKHGWPGWWSKIELFRPDLPHEHTIFLDLDTIVLGDLSALVECAGDVMFASLKGFNQAFSNPAKKENFASGVMVGAFHELSFIYETFLTDPEHYMDINDSKRDWRHGDQGFIASQIDVDHVPRIQTLISENYIIGKRYLRNNGFRIPDEARLIAWSGQPRLHQIKDDNLIKQLWDKQWN